MVFYKHLFSPNEKAAPTGAFIARRGLLFRHVVRKLYGYLGNMPIVLYGKKSYNIDS